MLQRHRRKDGTEFTAEVTFTEFQQQGRTLRVQSARDVSEREEGEARRRELEERLRAAQKMDAIGRMAGGVAHDFSNLLGVIAAHADYLGTSSAEHRLGAEVEGICKAAERGTALTRQLLLFSRRVPRGPAVADVGAVVFEAQRILSRELRENVEVAVEVPQALWSSRANHDDLREAILALAANARDAMPEGGKVTVRATNLVLEAPLRLRGGDVPEGRYVRISVADTGVGMSDEVLRRLFEPFSPPGRAARGAASGWPWSTASPARREAAWTSPPAPRGDAGLRLPAGGRRRGDAARRREVTSPARPGRAHPARRGRGAPARDGAAHACANGYDVVDARTPSRVFAPRRGGASTCS